jgi:hypothetical protein
LVTAAGALSLTADELTTIARLEAAAQSASPAEYAELTAVAADAVTRRAHATLTTQHEEVMREETAWLAATVRAALAETADAAPWAVLFLTLAWRLVLCRKVEHRLHPRAPATPSPFVYVMQ